MTSKQILLNDPSTAAWWNSVAKNPSFQTIVLLARSHIVGWDDVAKQKGAIEMMEWLENVAETPPTKKKPLTSGLKHDFNEPKK